MKLGYLLLFTLFASFSLLFACIDDTTGMTAPYTTSQFLNRTTDLNYTLFMQGFYDGNCLSIDGNKISVKDCNGGGVLIDDYLRYLGGTIFDVNTSDGSGKFLRDDGNWVTVTSGSLTDINALVLQVHSDGNRVVWKQETDSDLGRGTVLLNAIATAQEGDNFYLTSNTFDLDTGFIDLNAGSGSIDLHGSGKYSTIIKSGAELKSGATFYGQIIRAASNSETTDLSIVCTNNTIFQAGWGARPPINATNTLLKNVYIECGTDGIYNYSNTTSISETVVDSTIVTEWDNVNSFNYNGGSININVYDSNFVSIGGSGISGGGYINSMITNDANTTYNLFNTFLDVSGGANANRGLTTLSGGTINAYSGKITTSGASAYDLIAGVGFTPAGTINVTSNVIYVPAKTSVAGSGVINKIDNNTIAQALITLPSASASTCFLGDGTWGSCGSAGVDTNWETSWDVFDANMKATYALIGSGGGTDTNWETSWDVFDANMKATYPIISDVNTWGDQRFVPLIRTVGINGTLYDLSVDRNWTIATGGTDTNWQANPPLDNQKIYWGNAQDVSMYFDGTNINLNNEVGTGKMISNITDWNFGSSYIRDDGTYTVLGRN